MAGAQEDRVGQSPRHGSTTVSGRIRNIHQRSEGEGGASSVWTFRIERFDQIGDQLPPVPVQIRGVAFDGALSDGDEARVAGVWKDGTLHAEYVENITTQSKFRGRSFNKALLVFVAILAMLMAGLITFGVWQSQRFEEERQRSTEQFQREYEQRVEQQRREFCDRARNHGVRPAGC